MSATNDNDRFPGVENLAQAWLIPNALGTAVAVGIGDAMYDSGSNVGGVEVALPANSLADQGSLANNQALFGSKFCGVSQEQILLSETSTVKQFTIRVEGITDFNCVSGTYAVGTLMGLNSGPGPSGLDPQTLVQVNNIALAIGVVIPSKYANILTTRIRIYFNSRKASNWLLSRRGTGGLQGGQSAKALADAPYTILLSDPFALNMTPSTTRIVTLPPESLSADFQYLIANRSSTQVISLASSTSTTIYGVQSIAANTVGELYCDGTNWYAK